MTQLVSKNFSIDTNSDLLFDILRNKIYSDPVTSIIKEIISNARDAHREIDLNQPIDVNINENFFCVRDYGTGISLDRMENIFLKYLATTKKGDDKQTGGFGLGAKTPFAYTDSFEIISVFEGIKYQYIASIGGGNQSGSVLLINSEQTSDKSGTEIKVPIKRNEHYSFKEKFLKFIDSFNYPINYYSGKNLVKSFTEVKYKKSEFSRGYYDVSSIILDGVKYPLDLSQIKFSSSKEESEISNILSYNKINLVFNSRALDVSVNRELVRYTDKTISVIKAEIQKVFLKLKQEYNDLLSSLTKFDYSKNFNIVSKSGIDWLFTILPNPDYYMAYASFYAIYNSDKIKIPNNYTTIHFHQNLNDYDIFNLDFHFPNISSKSVKKYFEENKNKKCLLFSSAACFSNDFYERASDHFDVKATNGDNTISKQKRLVYKLDNYGVTHRVAFSSIDTSKKHILVDYGSNNFLKAKSLYVFDDISVFVTKDTVSFDYFKTKNCFVTDVDSIINSKFELYKDSYDEFYNHQSQTPPYSYQRKLNYDDTRLLFIKKYVAKYPDSIGELITKEVEKIWISKSFQNSSILNLFYNLKYLPQKTGFKYLDTEQEMRLKELVDCYLKDKIPLFNFLNISFSNYEKIVDLL